MRGTYIMKPIWKHCAEKRTPAEVVTGFRYFWIKELAGDDLPILYEL